MLRRYLFEITLATLVICGLVALFFIYSKTARPVLKLSKNQLLTTHSYANYVYS